jgi:hypothetical protein
MSGKRLLILLLLPATTGCGGVSLPFFGPANPQDVAAQPGDLPSGLQRCAESGDINTFLKNTKSQNPQTATDVQNQWKNLQNKGATDGYVQVFSDNKAECTSLFGVGRTGERNFKLAFNIVFKFKDESSAMKAYESGALGITPKNAKSQPGVTEGNATGLGNNSVTFTETFGNQPLYLGFWQNKSFDILLLTVNIANGEAKQAATRINQRVH